MNAASAALRTAVLDRTVGTIAPLMTVTHTGLGQRARMPPELGAAASAACMLSRNPERPQLEAMFAGARRPSKPHFP
jgi:hypothetical protein